MRNRSGVATTREAVARLTLDQIDAEIERYHIGMIRAGTGQGAKAFFKQLVWMEAQREKLHGVPAPQRDFRKR